MTRTLFSACLVCFLALPPCFPQSKTTTQQQSNTKPPTTQNPPAPTNLPDEGLPEEDEELKPKTYPLDPLESERNIRVGNFYMHKGTTSGYRAAVGRYEDATKYNPASPEAFFKLGEAEEKLKNKDAAKTAFERVVKLAPDSKLAREAKKKLNSKG